MPNNLTIRKKDQYFEFLIQDMPAVKEKYNILRAVGEHCHFISSTGVNLVQNQNILPENITIIDIDGTAFNNFDIDSLYFTLDSIGFNDWRKGVSGTGSGTTSNFDSFLKLKDTFKSFAGKNGNFLQINEAERVIESKSISIREKLTDFEEFPKAISSNRMLVGSVDGKKLEFQNIPNNTQYLNSFGYFDLENSATNQNLASNVPQLIVNNSLGAGTNFDKKPYGITSIYDEETNEFNFSQLKIGDSILIRLDYTITTTNSNQNHHFDLQLAIGSTSETERRIFEKSQKTAGISSQWLVIPITIDSQDIIQNPARLLITTDGTATFKCNAYKVEILQKDVNIISLTTDVENATAQIAGVLKLAGDLGGTFENPTVPALQEKVDKITPITAGVGTKFNVNAQGQIISYSNAGLNDIEGLVQAFLTKQDVLRAGEGIDITNNVISATGTTNANSVVTKVVNITSDLIISNFETFINNLENDIAVGQNEILYFKTSDTNETYMITGRNRSFGSNSAPIGSGDYLRFDSVIITTRRNYNGTGITDFKDYVDNLPPFTVAVNEILYFEDSESNDIVLFLQRGGTYGQGYPGISVRGYLKFTGGGTTQLRESRQIYTSGAQEFTLPEAAAQIVLVTVNGGVIYDYTILSDTLVRIDLPLVPTVRVVIHYLVDLNLGTVPYYTQAQIDSMLPAGSNKTKGSVTATDDAGNDAILEFDLNEVYKPNDGYKVVLPTTTEIGKEIYVFALNNNGGFDVQANQNADNKLSGINGIDGVIDVVVVNPNQSYRFIHRQNGYWYYELLESNSKNLQAVMDNGRTYNGNIYGASCFAGFFTAADGVVFSEFYTEYGGIRNEISFGTVQVALKSGTTQLYLRDEDFKIEKKQTTIGIDDSEISIVTAINFPAKTIAGDYKVVVQPSSTYTVATLPAGVLGDIAIVTDASSPAYAATVVGGGAVIIKVWHNGTNWVCN